MWDIKIRTRKVSCPFPKQSQTELSDKGPLIKDLVISYSQNEWIELPVK